MKKTFLLLLLLSLLLSGGNAATTVRLVPVLQEVSVQQDPQPLTEILRQLGERYGIFLTYDDALVAGLVLDFSFKDGESAAEALERLLRASRLRFTVYESKYYVLHEGKPAGPATTAKPLIYRGVVTDEEGTALVGVSITTGRVGEGTLTDDNGVFELAVDTATSVQISYVGYTTQVRRWGGSSPQMIRLEKDGKLPEIVVIGYGKVPVTDLTSSVVRVPTTASPRNAPTGLLPQWLRGQTAGVRVLSDNGTLGGLHNVRIRGSSSMNAGNEPLLVIDGMPVDNTPYVPEGLSAGGTPLDAINPEDVASLTILKDATAGAIYGSRAANGVILIETKRAELNEPGRWRYDARVSVGQTTRRLEVLDAAGYRDLIATQVPHRLNELGQATTDWQRLIIQTPLNQSHHLAYSFGGAQRALRLAAGYRRQAGRRPGEAGQRFSLKADGLRRLWNDQLALRANLKLSRLRDHHVFATIHRNAYAFDPTQPVRSADSPWGGYYEYDNDLTVKNPVGEADQVTDESRRWRTTAFFSSRLAPAATPGLSLTLYAGTDQQYGFRNLYAPATVRYQFANRGEVQTAGEQRRSYLWESYLNYTKRFGKLAAKLTAGHTYQHFLANFPGDRYVGVRHYDYVFGRVPTVGTPQSLDEFSENRLASFFARTTVSWAERYYLSASFRTDGSSRFPTTNRWASFPAVSAAWRLSREPFLRRTAGWLDELKLRAGLGVTGNQDIGDFQYLPTFTRGTREVSYPFGSEFVLTARPNAVSPNLKWEQTTSGNIGLEISVLNGSVEALIEAYRSETRDLLSRVVVPAGTNLSDVVLTNIGRVRNQGLEATLRWRVIDRPHLKWRLTALAASNRNRVLSLGTSPGRSLQAISTGVISGGAGNTIQIYQVGQPLGAFFVFAHRRDEQGQPLSDGVDHNNDGMINLADIYEDRDGNGRVDDRDKLATEQSAPRLQLGLRSDWTIGRLGLYASLRAQLGNYVYNNTAAVSYSLNRIVAEQELLNVPADAAERNFLAPQFFSDVYVEHAGFLRLDALTVDYHLPARERRPALRPYLSIFNLFTLTNYSGLDPEVGNAGGDPAVPRYGIDDLVAPPVRTFLAGVTVNF